MGNLMVRKNCASQIMPVVRYDLVSRNQTAFFRFCLWWRKKGLVWFTFITRLDTFEVSIKHVIIALGL